jgi:hypothetical protein
MLDRDELFRQMEHDEVMVTVLRHNRLMDSKIGGSLMSSIHRMQIVSNGFAFEEDLGLKLAHESGNADGSHSDRATEKHNSAKGTDSYNSSNSLLDERMRRETEQNNVLNYTRSPNSDIKRNNSRVLTPEEAAAEERRVNKKELPGKQLSEATISTAAYTGAADSRATILENGDGRENYGAGSLVMEGTKIHFTDVVQVIDEDELSLSLDVRGNWAELITLQLKCTSKREKEYILQSINPKKAMSARHSTISVKSEMNRLSQNVSSEDRTLMQKALDIICEEQLIIVM